MTLTTLARIEAAVDKMTGNKEWRKSAGLDEVVIQRAFLETLAVAQQSDYKVTNQAIVDIGISVAKALRESPHSDAASRRQLILLYLQSNDREQREKRDQEFDELVGGSAKN